MRSKIYLIAFIFTCFQLNAQTYTWQWAKTGGGTNGSFGIGFSHRQDEHILDMVVDNQNNTYYLVALYDGTPLLDGQPVTNYGSKDILLFSTDCQGALRWKRSIGGGGSSYDTAQKIVVDNNGGIYLTFGALNASNSGTYLSPRFGDNDVMPVIFDYSVPQAGLRYGHLLKYNTADGNLVWRRDFQGDVSISNIYMDMSGPVMDSQNNIHVIVGFMYGTHLNDQITVPPSYDSTVNFQYYLVKYDSNGNVVGTPSLLPIEGSTTFLGGYLNFIFDENNSRYYLGGTRKFEGGTNYDLSFNGISFTESAFVLAFNSNTFTEVWRKEIDNGFAEPSDFIFSIKKDPVSSDVYVSGVYTQGQTPATFGSYTFSTPLSGRISFVSKLSHATGNVIWCTNPVALSNGTTDVAVENARMPIALKGSEVLFAKGSIREVWGAYPMVRPLNDRTDPLLVKLNKDTGAVTGTHEILGSYGAEDHFTAIAVDMDNNIMLGGFIHQQLFVDPNDGIPTISNAPGSAKSNFFYTKLATSSTCSSLATAETSAPEAEILFYPNPVNDMLKIETREKLDSYEVMTADGRMVSKGRFKGTDYSISMQQLTPGTYFVRVKGENISRTSKVIKK